MKIILVPNPTGSGHNMRMYAVAREIKERADNADVRVLLGSLQHIFTPMFEGIGVRVHDLTPGKIVDYSKRSHLENALGWDTMIANYIAPTFVNGSEILRYMALYMEYYPDVVVSDFNTNATAAAAFLRIPNILVTERFNFSLVNIDNTTLSKGGFNVEEQELSQARGALNQLFDWLCAHTNRILTDKPNVASLDKGGLMEKYFDSKKAIFVGQ